jgi:hypothetical protein
VPSPIHRTPYRSFPIQEVSMFSALKIPLLSLALVAVLAPTSSADGFGISYFKKSKHGEFAVGYSNGPSPSYGRGPGARYRHGPARWVPGHHRTVCRQVWVPGFVERVWVEPVFVRRYDVLGRPYQVCVSDGHYEMVQRPGRYETRQFKVWVDGCWRT